ncbi:hypothetical protein BDY21DRAFT_15327 [Lineolata rhizophorae]|uniref:Uncharacterized protein n=1 Tax=Lineolata rhizophorae TaxID=578093 RepID=A0A6A6P128_9PEZI|nr:hypothetical protein BDY21DRAFT_15327 [Lineolata rhizophorae]
MGHGCTMFLLGVTVLSLRRSWWYVSVFFTRFSSLAILTSLRAKYDTCLSRERVAASGSHNPFLAPVPASGIYVRF